MPVEVGPQNPFKYILVAGPDKLGIGSFVSLMRNTYPGLKLGEMHNLMSQESSSEYWEEFKSRFDKGVISFFARRCVNVPEPLKIIPSFLREDSDLILWFELYAAQPVALKTSDVQAAERLIDTWKAIYKV